MMKRSRGLSQELRVYDIVVGRLGRHHYEACIMIKDNSKRGVRHSNGYDCMA